MQHKTEHDLFISHASEDKEDTVLPLAALLREHGLTVWIDNAALKLGDSLRRSIDMGLTNCRFGVVVLSPNFLSKEWPQRELDALLACEDGSRKFILPVLHNLSHDELKTRAPLIADRLAASTKNGLDIVAHQILEVAQTGSIDKSESDRHVVVGISGPSCSGKTWLAQKFCRLRPNSSSVFDLGGYYRKREFVEGLDHRWDNPESIDIDNAIVDLTLLRSGKQVEVPVEPMTFTEPVSTRVCNPKPIIILEGIFVFSNERIRNDIDIKVWIDSSEDIRYERRLLRDSKTRHESLEEIVSRYAKDVQPGYKKYLQPLREHADIIIENDGRDVGQQPLVVDMLLSYVDRLRNKAAA